MKKVFAITSNAQRFLSGMAALEKRGAREACWLSVTGPAGLGKSLLVQWYAGQYDGVYLRAKTSWTSRSALAELVTELGQAPARRQDELFAQALGMLGRDPRIVILDEVEHCLHDIKVLETFRDLSDLCECPIVIVGMEAVKARIQRHEQISSRITQVVDFLPASIEDVRIMAETLTDLRYADDLIAKIHAESEGRYRLIMDALAEVERHARRNGLTEVAAVHFPQRLTHDWRLRTRRAAKAASASVAVKEGAA